MVPKVQGPQICWHAKELAGGAAANILSFAEYLAGAKQVGMGKGALRSEKALAGKRAEKASGQELAVRNTELKEEVRGHREKQAQLLREMLQHRYLRYRIQTETEQALVQQRALLEQALTSTDALLRVVRQDALAAGSAPPTWASAQVPPRPNRRAAANLARAKK